MKRIICLAFLSLYFISCKKENDTMPAITKLSPEMQMLAGNGSKEWKLVSITYNGSEGLGACNSDNSLILRSDSTFINDKGIVTCGAKDHPGGWFIKDKNIFVVWASDTLFTQNESTINELTSSDFKYTTIYEYNDGLSDKTLIEVATYQAK